MNFLAPTALALGAISLPLIMLYMLRLRRVEMPISSHFLWRHLVRDREANAPWQRLKFNWLLLLQLLILAALVLALMRPYLEVETIVAGRVIVLLDASASMNAQDVGDSRFQEAQGIALDLVATRGQDDEMTVIRVSEAPEVLIAASTDSTQLRAAIRGAEAGEASADWGAALTLATASAQGAEDVEIVIISDGGISGNLPELPGQLRLLPVGQSDQNLAVSALAARPIPGEGLQLFAQISNYSEQAAEIIFSIELDGALESAESYTIEASSTADIIINDLRTDFTTLEASIQEPAGASTRDYLTVDNTAYNVNRQRGTGRILLVTPRNLFLSQIFASIPGSELFETTPDAGLPAEDFDLYVFDGWLPPSLPEGDIFIINPPNSLPGLFQMEGLIEDINLAAATNVLADSPITRYLDFDEVNIRAFRRLSGYEDWAAVQIQAAGGPLLLAGETAGGQQIAVLSFALQDSDLPLQLAYPIMIANLSQWYTPQQLLNVEASLRPGEAVVMQPLSGDEIRVRLPDGSQESFSLAESPQVYFADTAQKGLYRAELLNEGEVLAEEYFAVNLFDPRESNIRPQAAVTLGETTISEGARDERGQRELWEYLALLGLFILLIEWLFYHRATLRVGWQQWRNRPSSPTRPRPGLRS
jgi:hypothetical protein